VSPVELAAAELRVLLGEIATTRVMLSRLRDEIARVDPGPDASPPREVLALLAMDLHSWYTALESLLARILGAFEGALPEGESSHALILRAALRPIEGVRPAVLRAELRDDLDEIRRFRHFFRHAYSLELRADRLRRALEPFATAATGVEADLLRFEQAVRDFVAEIDAVSR
jgi:hypothetical protein